jgi:tetratricopeptide (TPR) repeat protein
LIQLPRSNVLALVAAAAIAAAGAVVGVTLATRTTPPQLQPQRGKPPVPATFPSPASSAMHRAFASWPKGSVEQMVTLARLHPNDPVVQFYTGLALYWAGYGRDASDALQRAKRVGRDTIWEQNADDFLYPQYLQGVPIFAPQGRNPLLLRGSQLQQQGHQHSAERLYLRAARVAPKDADAQVAAAVGMFAKDNLSASFSRLGPLTKRFPHSQVVRYYLGLLLGWVGERDEAVAQFKKVVQLGARTPLGRQAETFLAKVGATAGTGSATK